MERSSAAPLEPPRCPRCHCNDLEFLRVTNGWRGVVRFTYRCRHCGGRAREERPELKGQFETLPRCPVCRQRAIVYCTRREVRYLKCPGCGCTSKQAAKPK